MDEAKNHLQPIRLAADEGRSATSGLVQFARYALAKAITLVITVAIGLYLTILVANLGGYVDEIFRSQIGEIIGARIYGGWLKGIGEPERSQQIEEVQWAMEEAAGLHEPFLSRTGRWLIRAITLDMGQGRTLSPQGWRPGPVQMLVLDRLPYTLVLVGASNLLLFIATIWVALAISGKHGGLLDRLNAVLQSLTSAPPWIHGVVLIIFLAGQLRLLPFPQEYDMAVSQLTMPVARLLLIQMIMPVLAICIGGFFQGVYTWRSYFLIYREEDYVEMAKAKGLPDRRMERRYILRPALPYVLTSFGLALVGSWQGAIALEKAFYWPGVGRLFLGAVDAFNTPLILGVVVVFAYMLAITLFLVDMICALVDPRMRIGGGGQTLRVAPKRPGRLWRGWLRRPGRPNAPAQPPPALAACHGPSLPPMASDTAASADMDLRASPASGRERPSPPPASSAVTGSSSGRPRPRPRPIGTRSITLLPLLREILRRPSALLGSLFILGLLAASAYAVVAIPYSEAIANWRATGADWYQNPRTALPVWVNWFRREKLPATIVITTREADPIAQSGAAMSLSRRLGNHSVAGGTASKEVELLSEEQREIRLSFDFDFPYSGFPQDVVIYVRAQYARKKPFVSASLTTPDGRELSLGTLSMTAQENTFYLSFDRWLQRRYGERTVIQGLFGDPSLENAKPLSGAYRLALDGLLFEQGSDLDAELVVHGLVSGLAGTDNIRRDLMLPLLWGTPVALAFGLLAALGTNLLSMAISALGVWRGGWVDSLVQRLTEVGMVIPALPVAILVFLMYSKTIWAILGVVVLLNIFGSTMRSYRAAFIQMRDEPYIEAALAYGASGPRIIVHYLLPRILPTLIPQIVILIPAYVYYETTLAYLGVTDPYLPTWGKIIHNALTSGYLMANLYWPLQPIALLVLTSLAFTAVTFALERVLNPRMRER